MKLEFSELLSGSWAEVSDAVLKYESKFIPDTEPHTFIQWKGTNACFDWYCNCGHHNHEGGTFMNMVRCESCEQGYATGTRVVLMPLTETE